MSVLYVVGDARAKVAALADRSVDLVVCSSPFLNLRDYLAAGDPGKGFEIGAEDTPGLFVDHLVEVVEAVAPKLAVHGSIVWELGDTYSGSSWGAGGAGGDCGPGPTRYRRGESAPPKAAAAVTAAEVLRP